MTAPGNFTAGDVLTATDMNLLPVGLVAKAERTSDYVGIGTSFTTILSTSFTTVAGRNYLFAAQAFFWYISAATCVVTGRILLDTTPLVYTETYGSTTVTHGSLNSFAVRTAGASATANVTFEVKTNSGTVNLAGAATNTMTLMVQDLGDAI